MIVAGCPAPDADPESTLLTNPPPADDDDDDDGDSGATVAPTSTGDAATTADPATAGTTTTDATATAAETTAEPCVPSVCQANACGVMDDGCEGSLECGGCPDDLSCQSNQCVLEHYNKATELWSTSATTYPVRTLAWSPDGAQIATGGYGDWATEGEFVIWNSMTQKPIWGYQYTSGPFFDMAWSPDGKKLVAGTKSSRPQIYSATSGALLDELIGCHDGWIRGVSWRADGKHIASAGEANAGPGALPEWCIWDPVTKAQVHKQTEHDTYAVNDVAFSADGASIAVINDEFFATHKASDFSVIDYVDFNGYLPEPWTLEGVKWSPDNKRLLVWTFTQYFIIDLEAFEFDGSVEFPDGITDGTWSPSGYRYAIALADGRVRVHDRLTHKLELQISAHDAASAVDWSFHEQYIATGGDAPRLAVWRLEP